jgi:hypothetical protein
MAMAIRKQVFSRIFAFFAALVYQNALANPRLKNELENTKR